MFGTAFSDRIMKKEMIPGKDRVTTSVTIRVPVDVLEDLKRVASTKGMSGHEALMEYYLGQGLREDLDLLWKQERSEKIDSVLTEFGLNPLQKEMILALLRDYPLPKSA